MINKIINLVDSIDIILKNILTHTKDIKSQGELLKKRQYLIDSIEELEKKYDSIIHEIEGKKDEI